jgi:hypothetical protein
MPLIMVITNPSADVNFSIKPSMFGKDLWKRGKGPRPLLIVPQLRDCLMLSATRRSHQRGSEANYV